MDTNVKIDFVAMRSNVMKTEKEKLQYMILCAMKDNSELIQQFWKYSTNYDARPYFNHMSEFSIYGPSAAKKIDASFNFESDLPHKISSYHRIGSKQQSQIVIKSYIKNIQKLLKDQIIPIDIIDLCFEYYHFIEIHMEPTTERDFYKKYWIEAGKIGGGFQRIRKITRKSDKIKFALKMIKKKGKTHSNIEALRQEILILQSCIHENIVQLIDWCDTKKRIYIVQDYCAGG
eukprot:488112_1